jgi:hypothetical protein
VNLANLVDFASELQNSFRGRGLARINVGENANISVRA